MNETALWDKLERYLTAEGLKLDDVEWSGRVLRVLVDADGGIDVGRISETTDGVSRLLDGEADLTGPYTLEVSSPGLERKLRRPAHFLKAVGREVSITTRNEVAGSRSHRGVLEAFDEDSCVVVVGHERRTLPMGEVASAKTVFRWERNAKPGKARRKEGSR
ncbi:ribosome maturation factor RimP [bacterium BMS3Abin02]|nr:ribosome maturation factor RimP [bacterium BMS3Abin02]GBE21564.1 ribosome maturation factor RimP [bacterium BMS3Bbin01]HDH26431.1 ribosome maturation factor RimP [Actinomycetota bacterium]HDK45565.1 ribosome maturation factor RimP [Actinomycetota bacterium]HDL49263.1 ribosome maturation factor RimP [Actinomycetota bacterium]